MSIDHAMRVVKDIEGQMAAANDLDRIMADIEKFLDEQLDRMWNLDATFVGKNIKSVLDSWIEASLSQEEADNFKKYAPIIVGK